MVSTFLLTSVFSCMYLIISLLIGFTYGVYLMLFNIISFLILSLLLRLHLSLRLLGNLYVLIGALGVVFVIYYSGGLQSPVLPWLAAAPTLALMLMEKKDAFFWTFLMVVCVIYFGYLAYIEMALPLNFSSEWGIAFYVMAVVGLILIVLVVNLAFNNSKEQAIQVIARKNGELKEALGALKEARTALEESHNDIIMINHELIRQKDLTENKNSSITASLRYAKEMQNAIMPNPHMLQSFFADSFFLNKPLKIVSGDFFWSCKANELIYVGVVDCTGHGVPGAFMSVIGNNLLKEAIKLRKMTNPAKILHFLHKGICSALNQQETYNHDGMEVGLCILDEKKELLHFCGAKIPLLYVQDGLLQKVKGDNVSVGGLFSPKDKIFQVHTIPFNVQTKFYMFTDGLKDQFGGSEGKKFMLKRVIQTLQHVQAMPMAIQKSYIEEILSNWMKEEEQVDDITIIGFRPGLRETSFPSSAMDFGPAGSN